jgi:hypothetical protein
LAAAGASCTAVFATPVTAWNGTILPAEPLDWSKSFHPGSLEICLNSGRPCHVRAAGETLELGPLTAGFYAQSDSSLTACRMGGERHQFITVELSLPFLERHLAAGEVGLHPLVSRFLARPNRASGDGFRTHPVEP